jgi:molybdate transport system ATP-binding protein
MSLDVDAAARVGDLELRVKMSAEDVELVVLAGPNGAGKSSLLRILAGLARVDHGSVLLDGRLVDDGSVCTPAHRRDVSYLPQRDLLFPHLSVLDNVAFGPRSRGRSRAAARDAAAEWLAAVGLDDRLGSRPFELSGGQARRAALARALAVRPRLLLLDEPLAGIDASSRQVVRRALERYDEPGVCVLVAHEPVDVLPLATRVVVLEKGAVAQDAPVDEIRSRPRTRYVADFLGVNLFVGTADGTVVSLDGGGEISCAEPAGDGRRVTVVVPPNAVALYDRPPLGSPRNTWQVTVTATDAEGARVRVRLEGRPSLVAEITSASALAMGLAPGRRLYASVKATEVGVSPA